MSYSLTRLLCGMSLVYLFLQTAAVAGKVSVVNSEVCTVRLTGVIEAGDSNKVEKALADAVAAQTGKREEPAFVRNMLVCLNSMGGSYEEGLKLATYFIKNDLQTVIEDQASCISACAIAFMGGSENHYEDVHMASRNFHVGGRLGFHAPFVELPPGQYTEKTIQKGYAAAFAALGKLAGMKTRRNSTDQIIDPNLIAAVAVNGPDEAFFIDTVGKAARFGVALVGGEDPSSKQTRMFCNVCENWFGVKRPGRDSTEICRAASPESRGGSYLFFSGFGTGGEVDAACAIQQRRELTNQYSSGPGVCYELLFNQENTDPPTWNISRCNFVNIAWFFYFDPETPIAKLPRSRKKLVLNAPFATGPVIQTPAAQADEWNHNGSAMKLIASGNARRFVYLRPRDGLRGEGVSEGTVLFEGTRSGDTYSGTAYLFSRVCGPQAYQVRGAVSNNDRLVTLSGQAPRLSTRCAIMGHSPDTLVFEYLGP